MISHLSDKLKFCKMWIIFIFPTYELENYIQEVASLKSRKHLLSLPCFSSSTPLNASIHLTPSKNATANTSRIYSGVNRNEIPSFITQSTTTTNELISACATSPCAIENPLMTPNTDSDFREFVNRRPVLHLEGFSLATIIDNARRTIPGRH